MIRTQIYLPKELYQEIALRAVREKKPKAQVIRENIKKGLEEMKSKPSNAFAQLAKNPIKGLPADLSADIDKYLYEE
jgi:predicted DNA-binding protein